VLLAVLLKLLDMFLEQEAVLALGLLQTNSLEITSLYLLIVTDK
jgi:hypothetical protein